MRCGYGSLKDKRAIGILLFVRFALIGMKTTVWTSVTCAPIGWCWWDRLLFSFYRCVVWMNGADFIALVSSNLTRPFFATFRVGRIRWTSENMRFQMSLLMIRLYAFKAFATDFWFGSRGERRQFESNPDTQHCEFWFLLFVRFTNVWNDIPQSV